MTSGIADPSGSATDPWEGVPLVATPPQVSASPLVRTVDAVLRPTTTSTADFPRGRIAPEHSTPPIFNRFGCSHCIFTAVGGSVGFAGDRLRTCGDSFPTTR